MDGAVGVNVEANGNSVLDTKGGPMTTQRLMQPGQPSPMEELTIMGGAYTNRGNGSAGGAKEKIVEGKSFNKWAPHRTLRLYLGPLLLHPQRAGLILNLANGLVLPKVHF